MSSINVEKKKIDMELVVFFYSILFLPKIGNLDLKSIVLFLFLLTRMKQLKIVMNSVIRLIAISLIVIITLFLINSLFYDVYIYALLRYVRALYALICIVVYCSSKTVDEETIIKSLFFVISLHAIAVLISMCSPTIKQYIYIISGYHRKELPLRASGLVTGYDFAGFYLNIAIVFSFFYNLKYNNKLYSKFTILCAAATVFTSRVNIVVLMGIIVLSFTYIIRTGKIKSLFAIFMLVPFIIVGSLFAILTFDFLADVKSILLSKYSFVNQLDAIINFSYSNNEVSSAIVDQFFVSPDLNIVTGAGARGPHDPGYINALYEGGIVELFFLVVPYFKMVFWGFKNRKENLLFTMVFVLASFSIVYSVKLVFFFASGVAELLFFFVCTAEKLKGNIYA